MARILIATEDGTLREDVAHLLLAMGHEVNQAENGTTALRRYDVLQPDAVLMDVFMADTDGFEAIQSLRGTWPGARVIGMASAGRLDVDLALAIVRELGAVATLRSPFTAEQLDAALRKALAGPGAVQPNARADGG
jgi:CheY-like chemotaxis protein